MTLTRDRGRAVVHLWVASTLSSGSTWVMQIALFVHVLRGAPVSTLAVVELIGTVPALLAIPFAGIAADRFDPRKPAIVSMVAQVLCVTNMWLVAGFYALQGLSRAVAGLARRPTGQRSGALHRRI